MYSNMFPYNQSNFGVMPQMPVNYPWMPSNVNNVPNSGQSGTLQSAQNISQQMQQAFDFIPVRGFEDVKNFYVKPNDRLWFRFINDPIIALKFADSAGVSDIKYFNINEFNPVEHSEQNVNQGFNPNEYVSITAMEALTKRIEQLEKQLNEFKGVKYNEQSIEQISKPTNANATNSAIPKNNATSFARK